MYITYFLPAIVAFLAFIYSLRLGVKKNALIIAVVALMSAFLFVKRMKLYVAVNLVVVIFSLAYLIAAMLISINEKKEEKEDEDAELQ